MLFLLICFIRFGSKLMGTATQGSDVYPGSMHLPRCLRISHQKTFLCVIFYQDTNLDWIDDLSLGRTLMNNWPKHQLHGQEYSTFGGEAEMPSIIFKFFDATSLGQAMLWQRVGWHLEISFGWDRNGSRIIGTGLAAVTEESRIMTSDFICLANSTLT